MLRRLALSYWTPITFGVALLGLHLAWAIRWEPTKRGEAVTGFGACLIVLGLLVGSRPYIRSGLQAVAAQQAFPPHFAAYESDETIAEKIGAHEARTVAATPDVIAERVIAVAVIVIGTLLNGYGSALVRWLGWEG